MFENIYFQVLHKMVYQVHSRLYLTHLLLVCKLCEY